MLESLDGQIGAKPRRIVAAAAAIGLVVLCGGPGYAFREARHERGDHGPGDSWRRGVHEAAAWLAASPLTEHTLEPIGTRRSMVARVTRPRGLIPRMARARASD
jgi:hypothetical protein